MLYQSPEEFLKPQDYTQPDDPELRRAFYPLLAIDRDEAVTKLNEAGFKVAEWVLKGCYTYIIAEYKAYRSLISNFDSQVAAKLAEVEEDLAQVAEGLTDESKEILARRAEELKATKALLEKSRILTDEDKLNALEPLKNLNPELYDTLTSELDTYHDSIQAALFDLQEQVAQTQEAVNAKLEELQAEAGEDEIVTLPEDDPELQALRKLQGQVSVLRAALEAPGSPNPEAIKLLKPDWACLPIWGE